MLSRAGDDWAYDLGERTHEELILGNGSDSYPDPRGHSERGERADGYAPRRELIENGIG